MLGRRTRCEGKKKQFLRQYVATASPVIEPANRNFDIHQRGRLSLNFTDRVSVFFLKYEGGFVKRR